MAVESNTESIHRADSSGEGIAHLAFGSESESESSESESSESSISSESESESSSEKQQTDTTGQTDRKNRRE